MNLLKHFKHKPRGTEEQEKVRGKAYLGRITTAEAYKTDQLSMEREVEHQPRRYARRPSEDK